MSTFLERQQVRKQKHVRRFIRRMEPYLIALAVTAGGLVAAYGVYLVVFLSPAFEIREIKVAGQLVSLTSDEVIRAAGVEQGANLFMVDVADVHRRLHANPWIQQIAVRRHPPHALWIFIQEYQPAAIIAVDRLFFVDAEGHIFKAVEAVDRKRFAVLTGILTTAVERFSPEENQLSEPEAARLAQALDLLRRFEASSIGERPELAEINYDALRGFSLITAQRPMQIVLGKEELEQRLAMLEHYFPLIVGDQRRIHYIMAYNKDRIIVKYNT